MAEQFIADHGKVYCVCGSLLWQCSCHDEPILIDPIHRCDRCKFIALGREHARNGALLAAHWISAGSAITWEPDISKFKEKTIFGITRQLGPGAITIGYAARDYAPCDVVDRVVSERSEVPITTSS